MNELILRCPDNTHNSAVTDLMYILIDCGIIVSQFILNFLPRFYFLKLKNIIFSQIYSQLNINKVEMICEEKYI